MKGRRIRTEERPGEASERGQPTLREGSVQGRPTLIEAGPAVGSDGAINLVPGGRFEVYRLSHPLPVRSGEADLWVVERGEGGRKFLLKLYRYGLAPKPEVVEALRRLRREHVVEIFESGQRQGRHYEIQEYLERGSLEDALKEGPLREGQVREAVCQLADALQHLHEAAVLHRDIKPSNILVRSPDPLDLVLTDFGISSLSELSQHLTTPSRTAAYGSPESVIGVVSKASDWWSVGILLIELLTGRHPFAGVSDIGIARHLAQQPVKVPARLSPDWQMLIKGLLTRDASRRWGIEQVRAWLSGRRDMVVGYDAEAEQVRTQAVRHRTYRIGGKQYVTPEELAEALATNWEEGVKHFSRQLVNKWIRDDVGDQERTSLLQDIYEDQGLIDGEQRLSLATLVLDRQLPLNWKGDLVSPEWLAANFQVGAKLLSGSFPQWHRRLRGSSWLLQLQQSRSEIMKALDQMSRQSDGALAFDADKVDELSLNDPEQVVQVATEHRKQFAEAAHPILRQLLQKPSLDISEAVALLACDQLLLTTPSQVNHIRRRAQEQFAQMKESLQAVQSAVEESAVLLKDPKYQAADSLQRIQAETPEILSRVKNLSTPFDPVALLPTAPLAEIEARIQKLNGELCAAGQSALHVCIEELHKAFTRLEDQGQQRIDSLQTRIDNAKAELAADNERGLPGCAFWITLPFTYYATAQAVLWILDATDVHKGGWPPPQGPISGIILVLPLILNVVPLIGLHLAYRAMGNSNFKALERNVRPQIAEVRERCSRQKAPLGRQIAILERFRLELESALQG